MAASYYGSPYPETEDMDLPSLTHSDLTSQSDLMDFDSRPPEDRRQHIQQFGQGLQREQQGQHPHYQQQQQQHQYQYQYQQQPPPQPQYHPYQQPVKKTFPANQPAQVPPSALTPIHISEGNVQETEMPSLVYSDVSSSGSMATQSQSQSSPLISPSPESFFQGQGQRHQEHGVGQVQGRGYGYGYDGYTPTYGQHQQTPHQEQPWQLDYAPENLEYFVAYVLDMVAPVSAALDPVPQLDYRAEFTDTKRIAKGGNGEIRRAHWPRRQCSVILKSLFDIKSSPEKVAIMFDKEVEVMNRCGSHDNLVQFYGVASKQTEQGLERFMVMHYYEQGDLVQLLNAHSTASLTLKDRLFLALDIAVGLDHLFRCGFHHGDLHPKNILIDTRREPSQGQGRYQARLTDFGLRRIRDNKNAISSQPLGGVWRFMAPERMGYKRPRYDVRCDIFALGVIYWQLMSGRYPLAGRTTYVPDGAKEQRVHGTPDWYHDLYTQAWSENPDARQQNYDGIIETLCYHLNVPSPVVNTAVQAPNSFDQGQRSPSSFGMTHGHSYQQSGTSTVGSMSGSTLRGSPGSLGSTTLSSPGVGYPYAHQAPPADPVGKPVSAVSTASASSSSSGSSASPGIPGTPPSLTNRPINPSSNPNHPRNRRAGPLPNGVYGRALPRH